jgi:PAS domain S-box-containing protein
MNLKDIPIQRKLTTIILLTSSAALLLTCTAFIVYEVFSFRRALVEEMQTIAEVVAANSIAAVAFGDESAAAEILSALKAEQDIVNGGLYDAQGKLLAIFPADIPPSGLPSAPGKDGYIFDGGQLVVFIPVQRAQTRLGTLYLRADPKQMYRSLQLYGAIVLLVMAGSILMAFVLSRWLQRSISNPILGLADMARKVSDHRDFSIRAKKFGADELGQLTDAFNEMLHQIQERDAALRSSRERLRLALSASHTGIWDWDLRSNQLLWDEFMHSLFGLKPGSFGGKYEDFIALVHPQDRPELARAVEESVRSGKEFRAEFQVILTDGTPHYLATRGNVIYDGTGKPVRMTGVCLDITERKRAEEEIRKLNAELEERVELRTAELRASHQEMEAFTYSVSHDLRAPLRHIGAFAEILQEEFGKDMDPSAKDYLRRIMHSAQNMSRLVDDLLNLARIGRLGLNRRSVDLKLLVEEVIAEIQPEVRDREIEWKIGNLPRVECDAVLMKQVFANLISNSVKYTRPRHNAAIEVGIKEHNGERALFVSDNGAGFSMKFADKLFGVFQRLHRAEEFEGTGVGLATVQRILQKHGGKIWAEAEVDRGATFYFTIDSMRRPGLRPRAIEPVITTHA